MTTLAASIDSAERTITLAGDVSGATPGRLYAIDDEVILLERFHDVPDRVGETRPLGLDRATWVVQRGSAGSVPTAHTAGASVYGATPGWNHGTGVGLPSPVVNGTAPGGETIPIGVIAMWGGLLSAIPAKWHLCDGTSGTPDLRGLFIKGAAADPGVTGGAATHTHATTQPADHVALAHTGGAVASHVFTQAAAHTDHAALAHSAHAGATVGNHTVTQPGAHAGHTFTQPGAHTFTQPGAHTGHVFTQPTGHAAHVFTQPAAHVVTQPAAHSNHVMTQPAAHADNIAHVHGLNVQGGTAAAVTGTHVMTSTAVGGSARVITAGDAGLSQGTGASLVHSATAVDAHSAHSATAVDAHSGGAVDAHSAHSGGAVDAHSAHSGGGVDAHSGGAVDAHSAHAGAAVDAHTVGQASAHTDHAALSHSGHSGGAVDAHGVTQASQHAAQAHSGAAVSTVSSEPAFYSLAYIQKIA